jgi:hypothetical protein
MKHFVSISDLYKAYRKAKVDAHFDKSHFHAVAYTAYEQKLDANLRRLLKRLHDPNQTWVTDLKFLGGYAVLPKSLDHPKPESDRSIHFATLDPIDDWTKSCAASNGRIKASFRQVIRPTVDYQVISALWLVKVGHKFDAAIDRDLSFAHQLRRIGKFGPVSDESYQLFSHYIYGYRAWRSKGLEAMKGALDKKQPIIAVTMDVQRFYHAVSPNFLLRKSFLNRLGIELADDERSFTKALVESINCWYESSPDYKMRPDGALPVGLSASKVISNVLLAEFDRAVSENDNTIHYGRYADDVFLVVKAQDDVDSGEKFIRWLRKEFDKYLVLDREVDGSGLKLKLPYAHDSEIIFASRKQKIFFLSGDHGLDLVDQIVEQIKKQSSEYRLLPELPEEESEMLALALLATPDARLEADALRKAEAVSLRRLGFSFLLGDFEAYAKDLDQNDADWRRIRSKFYGVVSRYVVTPTGYFDYFSYIIRVFGLMVACNDFKAAHYLLDCLDRVSNVLKATTTAGTTDADRFDNSRISYFRGLMQSALESATVSGFRIGETYFKLLLRLARGRKAPIGNKQWVRATTQLLIKADLGRRPYQDYWHVENRKETNQPPLPADFSVRRVLALVREFRGKAKKELRAPYWPAIAFPTRPPSLWQLSIIAPNILSEAGGAERILRAVRGSRVNPKYEDYSFATTDEYGRNVWQVPSDEVPTAGVGVPSYLTTLEQWQCAFDGAPDRSLARYAGVRRLINRILEDSPGLRYVAFPECSLPFRWALDIAQKLARSGVSMISGIENRSAGVDYRNDALISLVTNYFGRKSNVCFVQPKILLSHEESDAVKIAGKSYRPVGDLAARRPIYRHGGFCFGVLICSDMTNIQNRSFFQGAIDALFVLEWNKDTDTFGFLIESAAHDLHAAIIQVNNRLYGDSRIRLPFAEAYRRDVVKIKGGDQDFYVTSSIDFTALRKFQREQLKRKPAPKISKPENAVTYKPLPIGYEMSVTRRKSARKRP